MAARRRLQWHRKAVDPPGDARSETWFVYQLRCPQRESQERGPNFSNSGLLALTWQYSRGTIKSRGLKRFFRRSMAPVDRSKAPEWIQQTAAKWIPRLFIISIYSGVFPRPPEPPTSAIPRLLGHGWVSPGPLDRRIPYNRTRQFKWTAME